MIVIYGGIQPGTNVIKLILRRNKIERFGVSVKDFWPSLIIASS
jgi:hypothetical protein